MGIKQGGEVKGTSAIPGMEGYPRPLGRARKSDGRKNEKVNVGGLQWPAIHSRYGIGAMESATEEIYYTSGDGEL